MLTKFNIEDLNPEYLYSASPTNSSEEVLNINASNDNFHLQDYWFLANSRNIDTFSKLFYFLDDYYAICPHRSSYQHAKRFLGENLISYYKRIPYDCELYRFL